MMERLKVRSLCVNKVPEPHPLKEQGVNLWILSHSHVVVLPSCKEKSGIKWQGY
jgi:hypothetical protein